MKPVMNKIYIFDVKVFYNLVWSKIGFVMDYTFSILMKYGVKDP
jgi:hypothetical protein